MNKTNIEKMIKILFENNKVKKSQKNTNKNYESRRKKRNQ